MPYCIYTDKNVDVELGSIDHIVPLALGGKNDFCIFAERAFNSNIGNSVDGAVANDALFMFARREADARGHSKVEPLPQFKHSTIEGRPAQITFAREELRIWDARERRLLTEEEKIGKHLSSTFVIDSYAPIRFLAKVVLGGGFFLYGEDIKKMADCVVLRELMHFDPSSKSTLLHKANHVSVCDKYHQDSVDEKSEGFVRRQLCEFTSRSIIVSEFYDNATSFHVGILGMFVGSITFEHEARSLTESDQIAKGHAVLLGHGNMERITFHHLCEMWWRANVGTATPPGPGCHTRRRS